MATLFRACGTSEQVRPERGGDRFELLELQKLVGGYIEIVRCRRPVPDEECPVMIVNEEGYIHHLQPNEEATQKSGVFLVGDVIQLTPAEWRASMDSECEDESCDEDV